MDTSIADIASLLADVANRSTNAGKAKYWCVRDLLMAPQLQNALARQHAYRELTAERFNVFDALYLNESENHHSRFISFLLDPEASHDQGGRFLRAMIRKLPALTRFGVGNCMIPETWAGQTEAWWRKGKVQLENHAGEHGRIDFVVYLPDQSVIAFENKINAGEGEGQLTRYRNWLNEFSETCTVRLLVFLTPDGRNPTSAEGDDAVLCMSYLDLADVLQSALNECPRTASPLIETVEQYRQLCVRINQGTSPMSETNPEILAMLHEPQHLRTALEIEAHLAVEKEKIKQQFRQNFLGALRMRLENDPAAKAHWDAAGLPDWPKWFGIIHRSHNKSNPAYRCIVEICFCPGSHGGWERARTIPITALGQDKSSEVLSLESEMQREGVGESNNNWLSFCYLGTEVSTMRHPAFAPLLNWGREEVMAIHADNQNPAHPLAEELAEWLWSRFTRFRAEVEKLIHDSTP